MALMVYQPEFYHREVAFCKVYGSNSKDVVERILLKNRISYFIELQKESVLRRIFLKEDKNKKIFIIKINEADVEKASELLKGFDKSQIAKINSEK